VNTVVEGAQMSDQRTFVFAGDSITDAGRDRTDPGSLGDGYVALVAQALRDRGEPARVVNAGVAGDRAVDLERRWSADVRAAAPDVLTVFVGVNDMWRRFDAGDPTSARQFAATYRGLLRSAPAGERLVLVEPFLLPVRVEQRAWLDDLDGKREAVRELAAEFRAAFVPLHGVMTDASAESGAAALAPDGVHPTPLGSSIIAESWWRAFAGA
jgi:lysophospholipase L1-like esterase